MKLSFSILLSFNLIAFPVKVKKVLNYAEFNEISLAQDAVFARNGKLSVSSDASVELWLEKYKATLQVSGDSVIQFDQVDDLLNIKLLRGSLKWSSFKNSRNLRIQTNKFYVSPVNVDMIMSIETMMNELDVLLLKGETRVFNKSDKNNNVVVKSKEWAGLGGRFGKTFDSSIKVPEEFILLKTSAFNKLE